MPIFSLYGEAPAAAGQADGVHIEDIQSRSRKYLWKIGTHRHALLSQCVLVTTGPVTVTLDETRADLLGPAVMIIPAGTVHSFRFRADTDGLVLTMDLGRVLSAATSPYHASIQALFAAARVIDLRQDPDLATRVRRLLNQLGHEFGQPGSWAAPVGSWLALSVLWILTHGTQVHGAPEFHGTPDAERLRRFRRLIEVQFLKHWPVKRYARHLVLSESSLNRLCRRVAGCTAFDLIQQRLALEARRRLVYAGSSVGRIATELGFKDPAYFSRFFRRHSGVSPNEFRRRHHGG
ncbi:MAG: helix-turn-helix domain-containing protein [Gammaproteobacteria bacterium]